MQLIGFNRSPFTRRVAITLNLYGVAYEQRELSSFGDREKVRVSNPLGRIPALVLDSGETLIDSAAIIDHLDETHGGERPLLPVSGADRRAVLRLTAILMGACEKCLHIAYERNSRPAEKVHQPWIEDCLAQVTNALAAVETMIDPQSPYLLLDHMTHADVAAVVAERIVRKWGYIALDTDTQMPRLHALTATLSELPAFRSTEPV